jgi:hypothetical protein
LAVRPIHQSKAAGSWLSVAGWSFRMTTAPVEELPSFLSV